MNDASKCQKCSSHFFYLEKCCINQAGIVVDELKQKHLHSVACFIFDLGSWRFQVSAFSGNNLEDNTTCLNILVFMSHGRHCVCSHIIILAHVTVSKIRCVSYLYNDRVDGCSEPSCKYSGILLEEGDVLRRLEHCGYQN